MRTVMSRALQEVGYQPSAEKKLPTLSGIVDGVFAPITRPLKVEVRKAGGYVRARYAGRTKSCFGETPEQAIGRLKHFDGVEA